MIDYRVGLQFPPKWKIVRYVGTGRRGYSEWDCRCLRCGDEEKMSTPRIRRGKARCYTCEFLEQVVWVRQGTARLRTTTGYVLMNSADLHLIKKGRLELGSNGWPRVRYHGYPVTYKNLARLIMGCGSNATVRMKNGNLRDVRRTNIVVVKNTVRTQRYPIRATSGYKGVSVRKEPGKWRAIIHSKGKSIHIGTFTDPVEAAQAYDEWAVKLHGKKALTNKELGLI